MADKSAAWLALAGVTGGVIGAAVTGSFNYLSHKGDLDAKMIELSVGILRAQPTPETEPLREWAIGEIEKRARFEFDEPQRAALLKKELPFKDAELQLMLLHLASSIKEVESQSTSKQSQQALQQMMEMLKQKEKAGGPAPADRSNAKTPQN
jgi:hypothetical protein